MPRKKKPPPRAGQFGGARLAADQPDLASEHQPDLASEPDVANSVGNISKADNQKAAALSMLGRGVRGAGPPEPVCRALLLSSTVEVTTTLTTLLRTRLATCSDRWTSMGLRRGGRLRMYATRRLICFTA